MPSAGEPSERARETWPSVAQAERNGSFQRAEGRLRGAVGAPHAARVPARIEFAPDPSEPRDPVLPPGRDHAASATAAECIEFAREEVKV